VTYGGIVAALLAISLLAPSSAAAARSEFFGIHQEERLDAQDFQRLDTAGIRTQRHVLNWSTLQPSRGSFDWGASDQFIGRLASHGIRPAPFVWGNPGWVPGSQATPPLGSIGAREAWQRFLAAAVKRYGPGGSYWANGYRQRYGADATPLPIRSWQIWNEPNLQKFFAPTPSPGKYAQLLRISRVAIKGQDPQARLVLAGPVAYADRTAWEFLGDLYDVGNVKGSFDATALHPYGSDINKVEYAFRRYRRVMRANNDGGTPLWVTEVGWGSNPPDQFGLNKGLAGQGRLLRKTFQLVLNKRRTWNVQRLFWYFWRDPAAHKPGTCSFCSSAGLLRHDHTAKPAYYTFRGFTGETDPPRASIISGPSAGGSTNDRTPSFSFASDEPGSTFQCRVNASAFKGCSSPHTLGPLADGTRTFSVKAIDAPGNESAVVSRTFTVDTNPPAAPRITDTDPNSPANNNAPEVKGSAAAGSIVWLYRNATCGGFPIGSSSAARFASPGITVSVADNTTTSFRARARDAAGNLSPCSSPFGYVEDSTP
jgi:Glycosyl hydrolase catalytic core/Beta-galactosidase